MGEWLRRVWYLLNRRRLERDLQLEMEAHREMMGEKSRFGNTMRLREQSRDVWGWNWLDDLSRDLRFALRTLRQSPGFTVGATLVLSLGIGLNLTLFQIYNFAALRPPEVRDRESVVELLRLAVRGSRAYLPYPAIQYIQNKNSVFSSLLISMRQRQVSWAESDKQLAAHFVSANWFDELGGRTTAGRTFQQSIDAVPDAPPVVLLTELFWSRQMSSDPNVVGSIVRINDRPATVIGILSRDYGGLDLDEASVWMPLEQLEYFFPGTAFQTTWDSVAFVRVFGRLKTGATLAGVRESLRPLVSELAIQQPQRFNKDESLEPYPITALGFETPRQRNERLLGVTGTAFLSLLVLTIACANLSNMVLSRSVSRLRELNIRVALGAGRWRVMRLLITETALLAALATLVALGMSTAAVNMIGNLNEGMLRPSVDWRTVAAALSIAVFTLFAVGLLPTWAVTRRNLINAIKDGAPNASPGIGRSRLQGVLTAVQVSGSCLLLLLAALTANDVRRAMDPGFDFQKVAILDVTPHSGSKIDAGYWDGIRAAVTALPETEHVAFARGTPIGTGARSILKNLPESPALVVATNTVEPRFFDVMAIPIVAGRSFDSSDALNDSAIVSRRLALRVYGTLNVIGQTFPRTQWPNDRFKKTIVGVAEDVNSVLLEFPHSGTEYAELYLPLGSEQLAYADLLVRARSDAKLLLAPMRQAARAIDNRVFVEARLLSTDFRMKVRELAILSGIALSLAAITLILACIGIFGVMSYGARLRRKELSIRHALGAERRSLIFLLVKQLARPAAFGISFGLALGLAASKILESQGIYLGSIDAFVLISVTFTITSTCTVSAVIPALRALRMNVAETLRNE